MHSAGRTEGGLTASFEKFILDVDKLQMVAEFLTPLDVSQDAAGLDAVREVGPGGHFFGTAHTLARYESAFYSPILSTGAISRPGPTPAARPLMTTQPRLQGKAPPKSARRSTPGVEEELDAFVAKRKAAGGVATDF